MMKYGLSEKQLNEIVAFLATFSQIEKAVLFGSRAMGTFKEASDVDIVIMGDAADFKLAAHIQYELEEETYLPFFFDIVSYNSIDNDALKLHIEKYGKVLYERDGGEDGWRECRLGDVITLHYGKSLPANKRVSGNVPVYSSAGLTGYHNEALVDSEGLVLGRKGTIGKIYRSKEPFFAIDTSYYIVPNVNKYDLSFIYYLLQTLGLEELNEDSAVPGLNRDTAYSQEILFPSLPEQKAIAEILSSLDDKIDLLHRQNKTLESLAETLFRQWFIEEASEEWEERSLDKVADFLNGLACQKYPPKDGLHKLKVLKIKDLRSGLSEASDWVTSDVSSEYIISSGDIIFSWSGSLLVKIWDGETCVLNQHLFKITSNKFPKWFYYYWTKHYLSKFISIAETKATTMGHIKRSDLSSSMVLVPDDISLEKMDSEFSPIFNRLILNNAEIYKLEQLRDESLPKLMNGEIRVQYKGVD